MKYLTRIFSPGNIRKADVGAIPGVRSYNRSLMSIGDFGRPPLPPDPPLRGLSSYNGVRVGSMVSFGGHGPVSRIYPPHMHMNANGGSNPDCNSMPPHMQQVYSKENFYE